MRRSIKRGEDRWRRSKQPVTRFLSCSARSWCSRCTRVCLPRAGDGPQEKPGQCTREDPVRFRDLDSRVFLHRLRESRTAWDSSSAADKLAQKSGYELVKFFFLLTFAAAVPAIVSGGIAERARFTPQLAATVLIVGFVYPFFESIAWNDRVRHTGVAGSVGRRQVPRLRGIGGRARGRRLDCAHGGAVSRAAHRTLHEGWQCGCASAFQHSVSRAGRMDTHRRAGSASTSCPRRRSTRSPVSSQSTR